MKKIIITGAAGFIGFHTAKLYINKGYFVLGIDNLNDSYDYKIRKSKIIAAENDQEDWEDHLEEAKDMNPDHKLNPLFEMQQKIKFKLKQKIQKTWDEVEQRKSFQELLNKVQSSIVLDVVALEQVAKILNEHHWKAT